MILTDVTDRVWARGGDRLAVKDDHLEVSFRKLLEASNGVSRQLLTLVRIPGQRVALLLPNSAAYVASFFAIARVGGVVAPIDTHAQIPELRRFIEDLNPAAVLTEDRWAPAVVEAATGLDSEPAVLSLQRDLTAAVVAAGRGPATALTGLAVAPLLQQYTSGSTGIPKRVVRDHAAVGEEVMALRQALDVSEDDRFIGVAPFSHVNGLVRTMLHSMSVGAALYPVAEFSRRRVLGVLAQERITVFGAVPPVFVMLTQRADAGQAFATVRVLFSSSAPLFVDDNRRFHERWGKFIPQLYGSTETGTISVTTGDDVERHPAAVGRPLSGVSVEVRDDEGRSLPPGAEGEIAIASPWAARGYVGNDAASAESFRDGWYLSGDLGRLDDAGRLTLTGRTKLVINRGGLKVNPYEVESVLCGHPKVKEAAVFGGLGPHGCEEVCCVVVPQEACTEDEIIAYCCDRLADYKVPGHVEFRDALPKASAGKVLRSALRRQD